MKDEKYVFIQSTIDIAVTSGLRYVDATNKDVRIENKLRINPEWQKDTILIKRGKHPYPAYLTEWNTVKELVKAKVFTIGEYCNSDGTEYREVVKAKKVRPTIISEPVEDENGELSELVK